MISNANRTKVSQFSLGELGLLLVGTYYLVTFIALTLIRMGYPFEIEWSEGFFVTGVQRLFDGLSLYVEPSINYVSYLYTPLYTYICAVSALFWGVGFTALRFVSFLASIGSFLMIYLIVYRWTHSKFSSYIATCFYAASFVVCGALHDLARVDSLFMFFLLAAIYSFYSSRMVIHSLVSPVLMFLSYFTKQGALSVMLVLSFEAIRTRRGTQRFAYLLICATLTVGSSLLMNYATDGWYHYYLFFLPAQHGFVFQNYLSFWINDIFKYVTIALAFCSLVFFKPLENKTKVGNFIRHGLLLGSLVLSSFAFRLHEGGYTNVLMPAYAGIAIYFGMGLHISQSLFKSAPLRRIVPAVLAIAQFGNLFYWPQNQLPSEKDRQTGYKILKIISNFDGDVFCSNHPWYLAMEGKPTNAFECPIWDIHRDKGTQNWQKMTQQMKTAIETQKYDAFILYQDQWELFTPIFYQYYRLEDSNLSGDAFTPVAGSPFKPTHLYVKKSLESEP